MKKNENKNPQILRLTREFSFEMAHALEGYDGACSQVHGHSYRLFVTVRGVPLDDPSSPKDGMLMDFGVLKQVVSRHVVDRYDHTLLIRASEGNASVIAALQGRFERVEAVGFQPTCENLVARIAATLRRELPAGVELFSVRLHETANSYAEWFSSDN